jgi:hypothetical protein
MKIINRSDFGEHPAAQILDNRFAHNPLFAAAGSRNHLVLSASGDRPPQ